MRWFSFIYEVCGNCFCWFCCKALSTMSISHAFERHGGSFWMDRSLRSLGSLALHWAWFCASRLSHFSNLHPTTIWVRNPILTLRTVWDVAIWYFTWSCQFYSCVLTLFRGCCAQSNGHSSFRVICNASITGLKLTFSPFNNTCILWSTSPITFRVSLTS